MEAKRAKIFWTGRSQAVRLPKEFRLTGKTVLVKRQGNAIVLEPEDRIPSLDGFDKQKWIESFTRGGPLKGFKRLPQGKHEKRLKIFD